MFIYFLSPYVLSLCQSLQRGAICCSHSVPYNWEKILFFCFFPVEDVKQNLSGINTAAWELVLNAHFLPSWKEDRGAGRKDPNNWIRLSTGSAFLHLHLAHLKYDSRIFKQIHTRKTTDWLIEQKIFSRPIKKHNVYSLMSPVFVQGDPSWPFSLLGSNWCLWSCSRFGEFGRSWVQSPAAPAHCFGHCLSDITDSNSPHHSEQGLYASVFNNTEIIWICCGSIAKPHKRRDMSSSLNMKKKKFFWWSSCLFFWMFRCAEVKLLVLACTGWSTS